jgi:hypothetical protein
MNRTLDVVLESWDFSTGEWAPSVASADSADSVLDPYIAWLALTYSLHFVHLDPIHHANISVGSHSPAWGWDFGLMAMTAARLHRADAIDILMRDTPRNR